VPAIVGSNGELAVAEANSSEVASVRLTNDSDGKRVCSSMKQVLLEAHLWKKHG